MLKIYKTFISPIIVAMFGHSCRFSPTCSEYMNEAVKKYGVMKGCFLGMKRVLKCNPFVKAGYDPVK